MIFFLCCFVGMIVGRKIGWLFSRVVLYPAPLTIIVALCLLWGIGIALGYRHLVIAFHPGIILKVIGYGAAAYISVPNYGLFNESSVPADVMPRHQTIGTVPWITFIAASIFFAFIIK